MKNFNISCLDDFFVNDKMAIDNVLTLADRQTIIKHALDGIRASQHEKYVPGYEHVVLYHGESIIAACQEEGLIENIFSLRDTVKSCNVISTKQFFGFISSFEYNVKIVFRNI